MIDQKEKAYFEFTLEHLREAQNMLTDEIVNKDGSYKDLQKYLIDYNAELDKFEIYDYLQTLNMIDKQGYSKVIERNRIEKLIDSPFFGRFDFVYEGDDIKDAAIFYIGRFGFQTKDGETLIYDWRAPVCHMYYEFELGKAFYEAQGRQINGDLVKKRQIKIENSTFKYVLDSSLTIQDEVLQQALIANSNDKMKTIVTSIQKEQNQIVRNESAYNVVIQGVAGSGKTAVALHRIAYYLYKYRDMLSAERIFILSPNKVFGDYISTVLPELGEQPIRSFTIDELTENFLPSSVTFTSFEQETKAILENPTSKLANRARLKSDFAFVQAMEAFLLKLDKTLLKSENIQIAETEFTAEYLQSRFLQYKKEPITMRLELIAEDITAVLKSKWGKDAKYPTKGEIVKRLKKRLQFTSAFDIYKVFMEEYAPGQLRFVKKNFEFNDVYPYLYMQLYFKGIKTYELVQHFVLDEMQDYTPVQYAVLSKIFECKRTIIGDFSQALLPYETISKEAFQYLFTQLEYVELTTTYRSSYEIVNYAKKFMKSVEVNPIERHGKEPEEIRYNDLDEMVALIEKKATNEHKSTAIICKSEQDVKELTVKLSIPNTILNGETKHFKQGVILTTVQYAKGLEFDAVVIPYVDNDHYSTEFDKGLLYIATTRAMHELTVLIDLHSPSLLL